MAARVGVHLQRLAALEATSPEVSVDSNLGSYLIERWSWGLLPATEVQKLASLAISDHAKSPKQLVTLSKLGSSGSQPSHCHHELLNLLNDIEILPNVHIFDVPVPTPKKDFESENVIVNRSTGMIAPFDYFATLYHSWPAQFADRMLGTPSLSDAGDMLLKFWKGVPSNDVRKTSIREHYLNKLSIVSSEEELWRRAIPISLHGDGVPVGEHHSVETISWASELGHHKQTLYHMFYLVDA